MDDITVYSHLFIGCEVETRHSRISMESGYPWAGNATYTIHDGGTFALAIHVPQHAEKLCIIQINGEAAACVTEDGYCRVQRDWQPGDCVSITFDMPVRRIHADPRVRDAAGKVALARGPLVYCVEGADHEAALSAIVLPEVAAIHATMDEIVVLHAECIAQCAANRLYSVGAVRTTPVSVRAIPYFAWGNREPGDMQVWIRET